jgi:guanylate kinase
LNEAGGWPETQEVPAIRRASRSANLSFRRRVLVVLYAAPAPPAMTGNVFIVSAPSGAGKTSLVRALLERDPQVQLSVSYTTRPARAGEREGTDYHFVTREQFERMQQDGEFLEAAEVHGNLYGTSKRWIEAMRRSGRDLLLEIDWQGAQQVRRLIPDAIGIFILPPSVDALRERLTSRNSDSAAVIARRLAVAQEEISHASEFDYVIINKEFDAAVEELASIVRTARSSTR